MIKSWADLNELEQSTYFKDVYDIFFESSSKKDFHDLEEKDAFLYKYLDIYLENYPDLFFVFLENNKCWGYICGMPQTLDELYLKLHPYLENFKDQFTNYPAHLHINMHADSRGKGLGSLMLQAFEAKLIKMNVSGVHAITVTGDRNVSFYKHNGYVENFIHSSLVMLSKSLR
jgi:GNAT superfamily N-acetyltransferase